MRKFLATHKRTGQQVTMVKFQALPERVQEQVHEDFIQNTDMSPNLYEHEKSLKEFGRLLDVQFDYSFDACGTYYKSVKIDSYYETCNRFMYNQAEELTGYRLATWIINNYYSYLTAPKMLWRRDYISVGKNTRKISHIKRTYSGCHLTGYFTDDILTETVRDYIKGCETTYKHWNFIDVMEECLERWIAVCQNEYEYQYSTDFLIDTFDCWSTLFDEDGNRYDEIDQIEYDMEVIEYVEA